MNKNFSDEGGTLEEQQLFQNLCLLGLAGLSSKNAVGTDITKFSFRRPSSRTLEYVLYQLYSYIIGEGIAHKEFKNFYPVNDSSQGKEFNQRISDWLKSLKDRGHLDFNSISTASQLRSASGYRLVSTLLDISCLALMSSYQKLEPEHARQLHFKTQIIKDHYKHQPQQQSLPQTPMELMEAARAVALDDLRLQKDAFYGISSQASNLQKQEEASASFFKESFYSLKATHQRLRSTLEPNLQILLDDLAPVECNPSTVSSTRSKLQHDNSTSPSPLILSDICEGAGPLSHLLLPPIQLSALPDSQQAASAMSPSSGNSTDEKKGIMEPSCVLEMLRNLRKDLEQYQPLDTLLSSVLTSSAHPYAIDGQAILAAAGAAAAGHKTQSSIQSRPNSYVLHNPGGLPQRPAVDVVKLVHSWVSSMEACLPSLQRLAGMGSSLHVSSAAAPHFSHIMPGQHAIQAWTSDGTSGSGLEESKTVLPVASSLSAASRQQYSSSSVASIVAPAEARGSHAALLTALVSQHQEALQGLRESLQQMGEQRREAGLRAGQLSATIKELTAAQPLQLALPDHLADSADRRPPWDNRDDGGTGNHHHQHHHQMYQMVHEASGPLYVSEDTNYFQQHALRAAGKEATSSQHYAQAAGREATSLHQSAPAAGGDRDAAGNPNSPLLLMHPIHSPNRQNTLTFSGQNEQGEIQTMNPGPLTILQPTDSAVRPEPPSLTTLDLDLQDDDIWAMDIDTPSAADIGAVLSALDCSPRTKTGLMGQRLARAGGSYSRMGGASITKHHQEGLIMRSSRLGALPPSGLKEQFGNTLIQDEHMVGCVVDTVKSSAQDQLVGLEGASSGRWGKRPEFLNSISSLHPALSTDMVAGGQAAAEGCLDSQQPLMPCSSSAGASSACGENGFLLPMLPEEAVRNTTLHQYSRNNDEESSFHSDIWQTEAAATGSTFYEARRLTFGGLLPADSDYKS
ncbi:hypothetical protein CEUSTIGMA_g5962.t1 [Chlamydomonas eustigma]|uniref:HAUS augmin-like complex subunit 6 N-terminal domain-containing protein n=1 Tax=Chlamydomonas eustigma TaxID=1157962 RepID=A0A250X6L6_9CHLO|nr:hypothetical protein CEUSTIGMA_g5962.t1 [Chlamydomonas eustigma]|eukprot:GAX78522.1 hypothetical protein CEUSTIGMA_g5962.t1 [Chlamydomonas eustigma]